MPAALQSVEWAIASWTRGKLSYSSQRQGQVGVNVVERLVLEMGWRWQQLDATNDDGVDGLIFVEAAGIPTGQVIFVQVKCHSSHHDEQGRICVGFKRKGLARNFEKWRRVVGAAILVHVCPEAPYEAHWVNLLEPGVVEGTRVYVPVGSRFTIEAADNLQKLCGTIHIDIMQPRVKTTAEEYSYIVSSVAEFQKGAREFYRQLNDGRARLGGCGPKVTFTAEGWRHITRRSRLRLTQIQSMLLLGCLADVIRATPEASLQVDRAFPDGSRRVIARAAVTFPFRQTCMVKVIMRRRGQPGAYTYSFLSVYEARRKKDVLGRR